jgi:TctA family transporter
MAEAALQGLLAVFTLPTFGYLVMGVLIGIVVGILPGVSGSFSLAVLIPFTFVMEPAAAFGLLLGAHSISDVGGSITAILLNTPGDAVNAATIFDGFPMTKKGQAGRAIGAAVTSSAIGGTFGALSLMALIPIMRPLVLSFAPPEFFLMAVLGIAFIAILSGKSLVKGVVAGGLGLLIGLIGLDPSTGAQRFTFGFLQLWDGIKLVPVTLGLFAIAEMIDLAISRGDLIEVKTVGKVGSALQGIKDTFKNWGLVLRCSLLGTIIGIVPGLGGTTASFFAYGHGKQSAKNGRDFGTGVVEGVLAPESANSSKEAGALVPTIAFGIPGSAGMAILLGAFYVQGLTPGPEMLTTNVWLVFFMAWCIVVANMLAAIICMFAADRIARFALLPGDIMVPLVLVLAGIGAYSYNDSLSDLVLLLIFGLVGYWMKVFGWPRPVLIIGLVLARIAEKNLLLSLRLFQETFFMRPISLVLIAIIILTLLWTIRDRRLRSAESVSVRAEGGMV